MPRPVQDTPQSVIIAFKHFKKADPILFKAGFSFIHELVPIRPKRTQQQLFASLVSSIIGQQVSTKAAASITARLQSAAGGQMSPVSVLTLASSTLRTVGLSGAKAVAVHELADAVHSGRLNLLALKRISPESAIKELSEYRGIGPWTAEMFLIFALGEEDVFSVGDLALVASVRSLYNLPNASKAEVLSLSEHWKPYRSYASRILWKLYDPQ